MILKNSTDKSSQKLKQVERLSRQTRHHRLHLNQMCDQKLHRELNNLTGQYQKIYFRSNLDQRLEEQRKEIIGLTVEKIATERQRSRLSTPKTPLNQSRPVTSNKPSTHSQNSCHFFSHDCQLYPCQPIYHYRSFMKKEHDQTLRERTLSTEPTDFDSNASHLQNLFTNIQQNKYQKNRRQLAAAMQNQNRLANRYISMERIKTRLDEESRLLHERLYDKKKFAYVKEDQYEIKQAIKRHLEISAKFCA